MTHEIALIVGSLRKDSANRRLAAVLAQLAPADVRVVEVPIGDLPLCDQDTEHQPADSVVAFKAAIASANGVIFVTPEYNRSIPGSLKNAIDHGSRPYGQSVWAGKAAGIIGVSAGRIGKAMAQQHLRGILAFLDMPTLGQPEAFLQRSDDLLDPGNAESRAFLQEWMDRFLALTRRFAAT